MTRLAETHVPASLVALAARVVVAMLVVVGGVVGGVGGVVGGAGAAWADVVPETGAVNISVSGGPTPIVVQPGASATTSFVVRNPAAYPQHIVIEIQGLTADDAGYHFGGDLPPGVGVVTTPGDFVVDAVGTRDVHVEVTAEAATPPGGSYAGLIVRSIPDVAAGRSAVIGEIGLPVLMTIGGASNDAGHIVSFAQAGDHSLAFDATFANTGNVHYPFAGSVRLLSGNVLLGTVPLEPRLILPGTTRTVHLAWPGAVTFSNLRARLELVWGAGNRHKETREIAVALAEPGAVKTPGLVATPTTVVDASPVATPLHPERAQTFSGPHARGTGNGDLAVERASHADRAEMALLAVASGLLGTLLPLLFLFGKRKRRERDDAGAAAGVAGAGDDTVAAGDSVDGDDAHHVAGCETAPVTEHANIAG